MELFAKTIKDVGWLDIVEEIKKNCIRRSTYKLWEKNDLLTDKNDIKKQQDLFKELLNIINNDLSLLIPDEEDLEQYISIAQRQGILGGETFLKLASFLEDFTTLRKQIIANKDKLEEISNVFKPITTEIGIELKELSQVIRSCFNEKGELEDNASPALSELRSRQRKLREQVYQQLEKLMDSYSDIIQDRYYTLRHDRYVIPVRTDAHRPLPGIVLGTSNTGATIFVEPEEVTKSGNLLSLLQSEILREEERIKKELSEQVASHAYEIMNCFEISSQIDYYYSGAKFSNIIKGEFPQINIENNIIKLKQVRHPILCISKDVIPNDIEVSAGVALIISGPNAGGKTVTLKTIGLCQIMFQLGLPVPASDSSSIPIVNNIFTAMGDEQSLNLNLSTFAAHISNVSSILKLSDKDSLIIFDELAGGTDPNEGGALATAIIKYLTRKNGFIVVTTHYDTLKIIAANDKSLRNASLGFDLLTMNPTYKISYDQPGVSGALSVAAHYGIPADIIEEAKSLREQQGGKLAAIIDELQREKAKEEKLTKELEFKINEADNKRKEFDIELARIKDKEMSTITHESRKIESKLRDMKLLLHNVEENLKKRQKIDKEAAKRISKNLYGIQEEFLPGGSLIEMIDKQKSDSISKPLTIDEIKPGLNVYHKKLKQKGIVLSVSGKKQVNLIVNNVKITARIDDIESVKDEKKEKSQKKVQVYHDSSVDKEKSSVINLQTEENTLDIRGLRVDEANSELDKFIDNAILKNMDIIFIVHGIGSGILKDAIRKSLKESKYISKYKSAEPQFGGDGVTVVWIK